MPNDLAKRPAVNSIAALLETKRDAIAAVLPKHLTIERMMKIALMALSRNPKLRACTPQSFLSAFVASAECGLEPNTPMEHAWLIPYENRHNKTTEAQFQLGYKGLIELARRSGRVKSIQAWVVYEGDRFEVTGGTDPGILHTINFAGERTDDRIIAVYATATLDDGSVQFDVMTKKQVDLIRARSKAGASHHSPWHTDYAEMARKTVTKRLTKYLPKSIEMAQAIAADNDDDESASPAATIDIGALDTEPASAAEALANDLGVPKTDASTQAADAGEPEAAQPTAAPAPADRRRSKPAEQPVDHTFATCVEALRQKADVTKVSATNSCSHWLHTNHNAKPGTASPDQIAGLMAAIEAGEIQ